MLSDSTIYENIAFGVEKENIDFEYMKNVCEQARILDFINSTSDGFNTLIGKEGLD